DLADGPAEGPPLGEAPEHRSLRPPDPLQPAQVRIGRGVGQPDVDVGSGRAGAAHVASWRSWGALVPGSAGARAEDRGLGQRPVGLWSRAPAAGASVRGGSRLAAYSAAWTRCSIPSLARSRDT